MALHSSDSLVASLKHVARPVWVHSSLFSCADQDGELSAIVGVVFYANRDVIRSPEVDVAHASEKRLPARLLQTLYPRGIERLGQDTAVGPPRCPETRPRGPSPPHGW